MLAEISPLSGSKNGGHVPQGSRNEYLWSVFLGILAGGLVLTLRGDSPELAFVFFLGIPLLFLVLRSLPDITSRIRILAGKLQWWHFLWLIIFLSGCVFRIRSDENIESNPIDYWALYRLGLVTLAFLVLTIRLANKKTSWIRSLFVGVIGLLALCALLNLASTLWSVYPMWTLYKSIEYLVDVALIAAIIDAVKNMSQIKTLFDWTWILTGLLMLSTLIGILVWPAQAITRGIGLIGIQIKGVVPAISANSVGQIAAILGIVAFVRLLFPTTIRRLYLLVFVMALAFLLLSQSRSPLVGFLSGLVIVIFMKKRKRIAIFLIAIIAIVIFLTGFEKIFVEFFKRGQSREQFASLTGRYDWWVYGYGLFKEQPLIGYGAYAAGRFMILSPLGLGTTHSIHSDYAETAVGTGLVGLLFLIFVLIRVWIILVRYRVRLKNRILLHRMHIEVIGILSVISVRSFFSTELIWHPPLTFLLVLGYTEYLRRSSIR